jgi:hypothetical protein
MSGRTGPYCLLFLFLLLTLASPGAAQQAGPELLNARWTAQWITCPQAPARDVAVCHLRKDFTLPSVPPHFVVYASADNRYKLFVNGKLISRGPSRGDLDHWRFETVDLAAELHTGTNVLAAVIWNYADLAPMAQMTDQTGFVLQASSAIETAVNTDASWKARLDTSRTPLPLPKDQVGYYVAGVGERVDGSAYPWGWEAENYDAATWALAQKLGQAGPRGMRDSHSRWMMVADPLPPQAETLQRLERVVRAQGVPAPPAAFLAGQSPLVVPAHTVASILLDQSFETTGYPELVVSGGPDSRVSLMYTEALVAADGTKGNRDETEGKTVPGFRDEFVPDGGAHRAFSPLWWRTYRYVQLEVRTGEAPLTLEDVRAYYTAYPFHQAASFHSDDAMLERIWQVGWRTAQLCAHETYMDCPYYEQLQYAGDTRIQGLISLYATGDERLLKNAIELLADSQTSEGLTQSRYPSALPQYISGFSLYWIGMMHDLSWYHGDVEELRPLLPNARAVLAWYEGQLSSSGLLGRLPWWPFLDWAKEFVDGVPAEEADGQSAALSLQFAVGLREMADVEDSLGDAEQARHDRALATRIGAAVYRLCWDAVKKELADTPRKNSFSQQANILAVLADAIPPVDQSRVLERVLQDSTLTQASYYFKFYLFRAMKKAGLANRYLAQLEPWRGMLAEGLTTFAETPGNSRSDCHAWSAHPVFDLLATVAGIEPAAPGFTRVTIEPSLGPLHSLQAAMPTPHGVIGVDYQGDAKQFTAEITLPEGVSGYFVWDGRRTPLHPGKQHLLLAPAQRP